jgi:L-asparaginase II
VAPDADRAVEAMLTEPYLVGGRARLDTDLMAATGDVVGKEGAEALACAAVLPLGLGVAVKIGDGGWRAMGPAILRALAQIDGVTDHQLEELDAHARPPVRGGDGVVGQMVPTFDLKRRGRAG